jgi:hypothetical protein
MGRCRYDLPALLDLLVTAQITDGVKQGMGLVRLKHHRIVFKDYQGLIINHALRPEADVRQRTRHLAPG